MYQVLQLIHSLVARCMMWLQPYLGPVCFVVAWLLVLLGLWQTIAAMRDSVRRAKTMHQIPCADCAFFTNHSALKCSLHPHQALSEEAIGCGDFETANPTLAAHQRIKTQH